jgi:hypothetical protein
MSTKNGRKFAVAEILRIPLAAWAGGGAFRRPSGCDHKENIRTEMADGKKDSSLAAMKAGILPDRLVPEVTRVLAASLGSPAVELARELGVRIEDTVRFLAVARQCVAARETARLSVRDLAGRLRVPQYGIRDIESGLIQRIQPTLFRQYISLLGLSDWYADWSRENSDLAKQLEGVRSNTIEGRRLRRSTSPDWVAFRGEVLAVKARIRLIRSFDQISHQYQGYTLCLASLDTQSGEVLRVAIGPATHEKHQFQIGDLISGKAQPVPDAKSEWANLHKASGIKLERRGPPEQQRPADPEGGLAPPLDAYRENGHRRLDPHTCVTKCGRCPWGLTMPTEIIIDQWNPSKKRWRLETHCYGPRDCARYRAGAPRKVPGRKSWMVWVDDDVEREE